MVPEKGLEHLLLATSLIVKDVPDVRVQLIGDGPSMQELKALANHLGITQNCIFVGWKNEMEVASLLSKSSVFAFPSLSEGLPKAVLEAMACGNAIVGSDLEQIREIVGQGREGFLSAPTNHRKFANDLLTCIQDEALSRQVGAASRRLVEERFDIEEVALKYHKLHQSLIDFSILRIKARDTTAKIGTVERCIFVDLACEKALP